MSLNSSFCTSVAIIVEGRHEGQKIPDMPIDRTDTRAYLEFLLQTLMVIIVVDDCKSAVTAAWL